MLKTLKNKVKIIYKYLLQNFFFLIYGKIKKKISDNNDVLINTVNIDNKYKYKIYTIKNSRLYTDTIHNTAIIKNNQIIEGASFQYKINKIVNVQENIVFDIGTPKFKKKLKGTVLSLLIGGGGNSNYWHWLFDVLPKIKIVSSLIDLKEIDYFLFPNIEEKFQIETLNLLNIPLKKRLSSKKFKHLEADQIITVDHPYNFLNDPFKDSLDIPKWITIFLNKTFNLLETYDKNIFPKKIYIDRSDSKSNNKNLRKITNENEISAYLKKDSFKLIRLSDYKFIDQVRLFNNAEIIIGLHGAGFANLVFCKTNTKIIEFKSVSAGDIIKNIAIKKGLNYFDITKKPHSIFHYQLGDIEIKIDELKERLSS